MKQAAHQLKVRVYVVYPRNRFGMNIVCQSEDGEEKRRGENERVRALNKTSNPACDLVTSNNLPFRVHLRLGIQPLSQTKACLNSVFLRAGSIIRDQCLGVQKYPLALGRHRWYGKKIQSQL